MPRLRRLSGERVIAILVQFGFTTYSQRGSHVKLRRKGPAQEAQTLTIPLHLPSIRNLTLARCEPS
ncbi:type II toxin-antitoxin system HicA family toxin [Nitrospira sp. KM1]|uniref:type II toxin-antitoxin system HicA family toxin n=1 Tax=Nitrospira sp. KM1 TaxID=1936990 RepID=UPI0018D81A29